MSAHNVYNGFRPKLQVEALEVISRLPLQRLQEGKVFLCSPQLSHFVDVALIAVQGVKSCHRLTTHSKINLTFALLSKFFIHDLLLTCQLPHAIPPIQFIVPIRWQRRQLTTNIELPCACLLFQLCPKVRERFVLLGSGTLLVEPSVLFFLVHISMLHNVSLLQASRRFRLHLCLP